MMMALCDMISSPCGSTLGQLRREFNFRVLTGDFYLTLSTLHFLLHFYQSSDSYSVKEM